VPGHRSPRAARPHWKPYAAEFVGTALLVFVGLSAVIYDFGPGSPVGAALPAPFARRLLTGFLFGGTGALIALSPLGRISGAHLDPVLSWAFWLSGSLGALDAAGYTAAQFAGALAGAAALPAAWGPFGAAVRFGATLPGAGLGALGGGGGAAAAWAAVGGEAATTFALVGGILWFVGHPRLRPYTPALIPPLVALLVAFEAPLSGTSMNPARSLGPALPGHALGVLWIYVLGPAVGAAAAAVAAVRPGRVHVAKIAHHAHDPRDRFHGAAAAGPVGSLRRWAGPRR
jgi:aquaporin Z